MSGTLTPMETGSRKSIPEAIVVEIIARLPLRSIARFKSVCKEWRSLIESSYLRSLFVSLHRNSSSAWSLMFYRHITEAVSFHGDGCKTWALPKSPASYIMSFQKYPSLEARDYFYIDSSYGLVLIEAIFGIDKRNKLRYLVGNPVLQEWVEIPPPPFSLTTSTSLVTRVVNGVVSSYKVVRSFLEIKRRERTWRMYVYFSETGTWTFKQLRYSCPLQGAGLSRPLNLNGVLYLWHKRLDDITGPGVLVAHDFYDDTEADDDECRIIPLPVPYNKYVRRCLTTSGGDVIYVEILHPILKVWKLKSNNSDGEWWQLSMEEINMASVGFNVNCFPLGMNPFDTDLVYLWSRQDSCVVTGNLRTQEFTLRQEESETWSDSEGCWRVNTSDSKKHMEDIDDAGSVITLSQFVIPQWMDPVPLPPN